MIFILFFIIQIVPVISWFLGQKSLPLRESFLGKHSIEILKSPFLWSRANFDGVHYISIARKGYGYLQEAFFPFYPKLIRIVRPLAVNYVLAGILISGICFLGVLILFKKLLINYGVNKKIVRNSLLWLVVFPTSFYFVSVYTESLFLLFVLLSFWWADKGKWLLAGIAAAFASYTRLVGIFLVPALLFDYYNQEIIRGMPERVKKAAKNFKHKLSFNYLGYFISTRAEHFKNIAYISLGASGLVKYMLRLHQKTGDALKFVRVQSEFGANRTPKEFIMFYQVIWRYIKMVITVSPQNLIYFNGWLELLIALFFVFLLLFGWIKYKIRHSWMIFSVLSFLLPTLTGTFSSIPRYVLVCFPCFLVLGKLDLPKWTYIVSFGLQLICGMLFVRGYWIA